MGLMQLNVFPRETKKKNANRRSRASGRIPAIVYGKGRESATVELDGVEFGKALTALAGRSVIFSLQQEGVDEESIALLREVQQHPVTDEVLHVDLFEVPRGQAITVPVQVRAIGESMAVKRGDASLAMVLDMVEVECLPRELPEHIEVDITEMEVNDKVFAGDLELPVGKVITDPERMILQLKPPVIFVEEVPEEDELLEGEEGVEGEEGEEGAEGEEKPDGDEKPAEDKKDKKD